jgi:signal transduction histidine kinase
MAIRARYTLGVEVLTGLVAGAAALSAVVALLITLLVVQNTGTRTGALALYTASSVAADLPPDPDYGDLVGAVHGLVLGETVDAVVVTDTGYNPVLSLESLDEQTLPSRHSRWVWRPVPGSDLLVGVLPVNTLHGGFNTMLLVGLGILATGLAIIAILTPGFLKSRVLAPLKEILGEAEDLEAGAGSNPDAARASFHRLVELLSERDRELDQLREEAEQRADAAEWRAATMLRSMRSAVVALDPSGMLVFFNEPAGGLLDLRDGDIGRECDFDRTETGRWLHGLLDRFSGGALETELEATDGDGKRILSISVSSSDTGETVVLLTDVTRLTELERRVAEEAAMADLGAVSAGISHEVGNTLCALAGFIELLGKGHRDERTISILTEAKMEVESAQKMIESFKAMAGPGRPVSTAMGLGDIEGIAEDIRDEVGGRCTVEAADLTGSVSADPVLLRRCILNLVRNSLEASVESSVVLSLEQTDGELVIRVTDDGPGFGADTELPFRPLYSTKREEGNMGIGLTVTRRIIAAFNGTVTASNGTDGRGAVVTVSLPLIREVT